MKISKFQNRSLIVLGILLVAAILFLYFVNPLQKLDRRASPWLFLVEVGLMVSLLFFPKRKVAIVVLLYLCAVGLIVDYFFL